MTKKQYVLTKDGCEALRQLLKLVYPKGYSNVTLSDDTKLDRGKTVPKILKMLHNHPPESIEAVQYIKLEQLFDALNSKLKNPGDKGKYEFKTCYCEEASPRPAVSHQPKLSSIVPTNSVVSTDSLHQQLAKQLDNLNYIDGQRVFDKAKNRLKPTGVFLIEVCDTRVQSWLVKRLAQQVPGFENGTRLEINVARIGASVENICADLARQLNLSFDTVENTVSALSDTCCQGKTVIIVLSRIQKFDEVDETAKMRLMEKFWLPLVQQIRSQQRDWRSRLVLFLIQDGARLEKRVMFPWDDLIALESLVKIDNDDVQGWFEDPNVFNLLASQIGVEAADNFMRQNQISNWDSHPWITLENICNIFQIDILEMEPLLKLVAGVEELVSDRHS